MTLLEKLSKITEELGGLGKGGNNTHNKYNYVKGEDAMKEFRALEVANRIKVIPSLKPETIRVEFTEKGQVTTAVIDYIIHDLDSKDTITVSILGQGYDSTDKSAYKLATGAFKYFLLQTFSYSTDDPEKEDSKTVNHSVGKTKTVAAPVATTFTKPSFTKTSAPIAKPVVAPVTEVETNDDSVEQSTTVSPSRFQPKGGFTKVVAPVNQGVVASTSTVTAPAFGSTTNGTGTKPTFTKGKFSEYLASKK